MDSFTVNQSSERRFGDHQPPPSNTSASNVPDATMVVFMFSGTPPPLNVSLKFCSAFSAARSP